MGPGQQLDPLGHDGAQVGVDHHQGLHLERLGDLEDGAQRGALAAHAVDLGIGQREALQAVARPDQQDALDVVGRLGLDDDASGAVGRAGVGVDQDRLAVGEVLHQAGLCGTRDVADGGRVSEAGDADHDVGWAKPLDLFGKGFGERSIWHVVRLAQAAPGSASRALVRTSGTWSSARGGPRGDSAPPVEALHDAPLDGVVVGVVAAVGGLEHAALAGPCAFQVAIQVSMGGRTWLETRSSGLGAMTLSSSRLRSSSGTSSREVPSTRSRSTAMKPSTSASDCRGLLDGAARLDVEVDVAAHEHIGGPAAHLGDGRGADTVERDLAGDDAVDDGIEGQDAATDGLAQLRQLLGQVHAELLDERDLGTAARPRGRP